MSSTSKIITKREHRMKHIIRDTLSNYLVTIKFSQGRVIPHILFSITFQFIFLRLCDREGKVCALSNWWDRYTMTTSLTIVKATHQERIYHRCRLEVSFNSTQVINHHILCPTPILYLQVKFLKEKHPPDQSWFCIRLFQEEF